MSGKFLRIQLADGDEYEMPEDDAFGAMSDLEKRGVKFDATEAPAVRGDVQIGEPEVIKTDPELEANKAHVMRMLQDPAYFGKQLVGAGGKYIGGMIGGAGGAAEGLVANMGRQGIAGGVEAGSAAVAADKGPWQAALDTLQGGAVSAAGAGTLDALGRGVSKVGEGAHWLADKARNTVAGINATEAKGIAKKNGLDAVDDMGRSLEELSPSPWYGWSSGRHSKDLAAKMEPEGARIGAALERAGKDEGVDSLVPDSWQRIQDALERRAGSLDARAVTEGQIAGANSAGRVAERAAGQDVRSLQDLAKRKSEWQAEGFSGPGGTVSDAAAKQTAADVGTRAKDELAGLMEYALPETRTTWREANDKFSKLATLEELTRNTAGGEFTAGDVATSLLGAAAGAGVGAGASLLTDGDDAASYGTAGAMGGLFTGTRSAARQAAGTWGADVAANAFRGAGRQMTGAGGALRSAGQQAGAPLGALYEALRLQNPDDEEQRY